MSVDILVDSQLIYRSIKSQAIVGRELVNTRSIAAGFKITAGQRTMSGQDDYLFGQNFGLAVILTGHVRGFQIIN